uniref:Uncharacterized protein n=1 Tax=Arion vulgaris TaxID=1028688 RepID=A0A0B6XZQ7_9EUPU
MSNKKDQQTYPSRSVVETGHLWVSPVSSVTNKISHILTFIILSERLPTQYVITSARLLTS